MWVSHPRQKRKLKWHECENSVCSQEARLVALHPVLSVSLLGTTESMFLYLTFPF